MLRGSARAKIDDRGRLKVPVDFRRLLEKAHGATPEMFVTSFEGESVRVYPFPVWSEIEQKLTKLPKTHPTRIKFLTTVNSWGSLGKMDSQGRILLPEELRKKTKVAAESEVVVIGQQDFLHVWNTTLLNKVRSQPLTREDLNILADAGI